MAALDEITVSVIDMSRADARANSPHNNENLNGHPGNAERNNDSVTNGNVRSRSNGHSRNARSKTRKSKRQNSKSASWSRRKNNSKFSTLQRFTRRDKSEVSVLIKYIVFFSNVIFWLVGAFLIAVGVWAAVEKRVSSNISSFSTFNPAVPIIIIGLVVFIVGFFGCVGALRENTYLLLVYIVLLVLILLLLIAAVIIVFGFKDWLKQEVTRSGLTKILPKYRDDIDLENFIDWVQGDWLKCCGLTTYEDWRVNMYFNCSSPGIEACGYPYSCCLPDSKTNTVDRQCGFVGRVNRTSDFVETVIYTKGCIQAGEDWVNKYIVAIAGVIVAIAVVLILGIGFALVLRSDINAQKAKWVTTRL